LRRRARRNPQPFYCIMSETAEQSNETVVEVIGLAKIFRDFWHRPKANAVDDISFQVGRGEIFGLLGPNGSGKSTTIKMLLGLLYPTAGIISVFGKDPRDTKTKHRVGYLPEESYLYKYLTASETLDFYGALFNLPASERKRRTEQLLDMVGLAHAKRRPVGEFSKGMARRIGLAQAMINDPDLLILDEPTSGLDPIGCKEIKELLLLLKKWGKTVIISSHLLSDVEDICDRVAILYGGKIRASGALNKLLTVSDANTITTPALSPKEMEKVLAALRKLLHGDKFKVDHPKRSLEDFFLDIVSQAKSENVATSGVVSGGKIADYLSGGDEEKKKLLAELARPREEKTAGEKRGDVATEERSVVAKAAEKKLDELAERKKTAESQEACEPAKSAEREERDLEEANKKLSELLNGK